MRFQKSFVAIAAMAAIAIAQLASAEPVAFTVKFPVGQVDHQANVMDMQQTVSSPILPTPKTQSMKMVAKTTLKTLKSDASGSTVEVTYDSMKLSGSMLKAAGDTLDKTLDAFVGQKVQLHFSSQGKVDKVEGVDAILSKLPAGTSQAAVKAILSDERVKDQYNSAFQQLLPSHPVSVGDTWQTDVSHKVGNVEVKIQSRVKLTAIDERDGHKIAKLEFTGKGKFDAGTAAGAPKMNFDHLDQDGTAEFDLTRGWLTAQNTEQTMKGSVSLHGPKNAAVNLNIDQSVKVKTTTSFDSAVSTAAKAGDATPAPAQDSAPKPIEKK